MPKYTVKNKESGQTITFNWNGEEPPSDSDIEEVFVSAKEFKAPQETIEPQAGGDFISTMSPDISESPPYSLEDTEQYVRPVLEYGGMAAGGVVGAGSGPAGAIVGAGLGYGAGKKGADLVYGKPQGTVGEELLGSAVDVSQGAAMEMGGGVVGRLVGLVGKPTAKKMYEAIERGVQKSIRPGVGLQRTAEQTKQYFKRASDAVTTIIINKNSLRLTDKSGKVVTGLPKTLKQFSEAIGQTKKMIFDQYDDLARAASKEKKTTFDARIQPKPHKESVIRIELKSTSDELLGALSSDPFKDMAPGAAKYAAKRAKILRKRGSYSASETQEAIQILNNSLEAYYKNPSYETATIAKIDALIANNLRRQLDKKITDLTGSSYQQLKNVYGALSHIEKDVARRTAVDARKNIKGLIDFSDIYSAAELVHGIVSMSPGYVAKGIMAKTVATFYRHVNNPNRIVKNMFSEVEKMLIKKELAVSKSIASSASGRAMGRTAAYGGQQIFKEEQQ